MNSINPPNAGNMRDSIFFIAVTVWGYVACTSIATKTRGIFFPSSVKSTLTEAVTSFNRYKSRLQTLTGFPFALTPCLTVSFFLSRALSHSRITQRRNTLSILTSAKCRISALFSNSVRLCLSFSLSLAHSPFLHLTFSQCPSLSLPLYFSFSLSYSFSLSLTSSPISLPLSPPLCALSPSLSRSVSLIHSRCLDTDCDSVYQATTVLCVP